MSFEAKLIGLTQNDYAQEFEHCLADWGFNIHLHNHIVKNYGKATRTWEYHGYQMLDCYDKIPLTRDQLEDIQIAAVHLDRTHPYDTSEPEYLAMLIIKEIVNLEKGIEHFDLGGLEEWQKKYHRAVYYQASY